MPLIVSRTTIGVEVMTKIIMMFWVLTNSNITEPVEIGNFRTMEECEVAAHSLTVSNPKEKRTFGYVVIARCIEVPK